MRREGKKKSPVSASGRNPVLGVATRCTQTHLKLRLVISDVTGCPAAGLAAETCQQSLSQVALPGWKLGVERLLRVSVLVFPIKKTHHHHHLPWGCQVPAPGEGGLVVGSKAGELFFLLFPAVR